MNSSIIKENINLENVPIKSESKKDNQANLNAATTISSSNQNVNKEKDDSINATQTPNLSKEIKQKEHSTSSSVNKSSSLSSSSIDQTKVNTLLPNGQNNTNSFLKYCKGNPEVMLGETDKLTRMDLTIAGVYIFICWLIYYQLTRFL
jgi:hypothetical protein